MDSQNAKTGSMKAAIEKILTAHQPLTAFREHEHYSVKIESNGFMPFIIEKQGDCRGSLLRAERGSCPRS